LCVSISFLGAAFEKGTQAAKVCVDEFLGGSKSQKVEHCVDAVANEEEEKRVEMRTMINIVFQR
jgi:hypothetical protein